MEGAHNVDVEAANRRLKKSGTYRDLSTVIICPTHGLISATIVQAWMGLIKPMNQRVVGPIFIQGMEVGEAYEAALTMILDNPELSTYKYILSIEEDNAMPPNGLMQLYESIEGEVDGNKYDAVGGLYWTKGIEGQPMCYGSPYEMPKNFIPQMPAPETVTPCNGLGQGFTLYRMAMFQSGKIERPFFKTLQTFIQGQGTQMMTQDLFFFERAGKLGFRFACDSRVRVGHWDQANFQMW